MTDTSTEAVERVAKELESLAPLCSNPLLEENWKQRATLLRALARERDEVRNKALDEAAKVVNEYEKAILDQKNPVGAANAAWKIAAAILALKT
jgi:hypothetical protein